MTLIEQIVREFGAQVRTQYHLQIPCKGGWHNIYLDRCEYVKVQCYGESRCRDVGYDLNLLRRLLGDYRFEATDLGVAQLAMLMKRAEATPGVWVDAGWRNGQGQIAVVSFDGKRTVAIRERVATATSVEAEAAAVRLALEQFPGRTIYTDCRDVAVRHGAPVEWIPREKNRNADRLANVRS